MKVSIESGMVFVGNLYFSDCEATGGRENVQPGRYPLTAQYSETHGRELPHADGFGWLGADAQCDFILGRVRGKHGLIPCQATVQRLLNLINTAVDRDGKTVELAVA